VEGGVVKVELALVQVLAGGSPEVPPCWEEVKH
jgi:hypothetical protein